jgi:predicted ATPase
LINPYWMTFLASALGQDGQMREGLQMIAEAIELIERTDDRMTEAEVYRVKGELLLADGVANERDAETCFLKAIDIAHAQHARTWELRAATSLARLYRSQGKSEEARGVLQPIVNWFTEGLETPNLKDAIALLNELS